MPVNWPTTGRTPGSAMDYIRQLKGLTAFATIFEFNSNAIRLDNLVFRLHSTVTVLILLVGTFFVSMRQYFGEPIECLATRNDINQQMLQHYCWLESTFSVPGHKYEQMGSHHAYPGVRQQMPSEKKVYHKYYQWVYFVLVIQAVLFYVPRHVWKTKEAKRLRNIITELRQNHILERNEYDRERIVQDVFDSLLISSDYFSHFLMCELMYLVHLVFQFWFTNMFLGGSFLWLGLEWLNYTQNAIDNMGDPLIRVFPRLTKCTFQKYGFSGSIEGHDALCFLPLNIVNEKIYVVLWFWFVFLFIITVAYIGYRFVLLVSSKLRFWRLKSIAPSTDKKHLKFLSKSVGNWFIINFFAIHMKPSHFRDMIEELMKNFDMSMGKPVYKSQVTKAIANGLASNPPPNSKISSKNDKKKSSKMEKNSKYEIGFSPASAPGPGFVVKRDPPSGHSGDSDDWVGIGSGTEDPLNEQWP